jgi:hypothetical protein
LGGLGGSDGFINVYTFHSAWIARIVNPPNLSIS